ncbi:hypothetical protein FZEAL_10457 [Fusarium zealandicum]|uniref:Uncharacterized protein n=1 Tax=Fusarium zealandicum TaxID=1053134 RepID=A0A8H4XAH4_9HYPO|nr:hypothetical protein FZEAL_10457 [Fusarium zealandicum]
MKFTTGLSVLALAIGAIAEHAWTNPDGGNTHVDIGDKKVAYGYTLPWYAFDKIKEECPSSGCNSENKIEYNTGVIQEGEMKSATITVSVEGSFNDAGEKGNRDDMVDIVKAVAGASDYEFGAGVIYHTGNGCVSSGFTPCAPGNEEHSDHLLEDMSVSVKVDLDDVGAGVCSDLATAAAGLIGAISNLASGIFVLAGLACA